MSGRKRFLAQDKQTRLKRKKAQSQEEQKVIQRAMAPGHYFQSWENRQFGISSAFSSALIW